MAVIHFLLVYDLNLGRLVHQAEFSDAEKAAAEYAHLEQEHRGNHDLEIVLVGADSLETIQMTHGHYFDGKDPATASPYLTGV
jgi:hypothetical protein